MNLFLFKQFYETFSQPKTFVCARRMQFWQTQRNCFYSRPKNVSLMSEDAKGFFFFRNYFGLKVLFWTLRKQLWQTFPFRKPFNEKPKPIRSMSEDENFFFRKIISPKCFVGHVECRFDNTVSILLPDGQKFFSNGPKRNFLYGKFFLKAFLCTRITQFWLVHLLSFARKLLTFSSVLATDKITYVFFPKF